MTPFLTILCTYFDELIAVRSRRHENGHTHVEPRQLQSIVFFFLTVFNITDRKQEERKDEWGDSTSVRRV